MSKANSGTRPRPGRAPGDIAAVALVLFGVIAAAVTVIAIVESYSNLLAFALDHGLHGWRAAIAPAAVDSFIIMGELLLFAGLLLGWDSVAAYVLGFCMAVWGFLLSVGGNIWHSPSASLTDRLVAAIWPVTATAGLAGGLIIIKRVMAGTGDRAAVSPLAGEAPPSAPPLREPRREARTGENGLAAASRELEQAVLAELLADPGRELPSWRALSREKFSTEKSPVAKRVLEAARAARNGGGS